VTDPTGGQHVILSSTDGLIDRRLANGSRELSQYDKAGRCLRKIVLAGRADEAWTREFVYNSVGNLAATKDNKRGDVAYEYDLAGKLIASRHPDRTEVFQYDAARNLVAQPGLNGVSLTDGNRLATANGDRFTYNDRDHLSERSGPHGTTRYSYNDRDQLTRIVSDDLDWTAEYDPLGRRIRKSWNGHTVEFYWDQDRLAAEVRDNRQTRLYVYESPVARVPFMFVDYDTLKSDPKSGRCYFIFADQRGCPIRVEDMEGNAVWEATVDPYGRAHVAAGSTVPMPLRFPGHYYDEETGLCDNRFRSYLPELGRYLQSDPAGLGGGVNLYAYPANPLTDVDMLGLHSLMSRFVKGISDLGAKCEQAWKKVKEFVDIKRSGMDPKHVKNLQEHCAKTKTMAVIRHSNPQSLPHHGKARPKPVDVKQKTAKSGPNAGLVTGKADDLTPSQKAAGYKYDEQGVLRDKDGNAIHGDYDMQGMYDMNKQPPEPLPTNDPKFQQDLNDTVCPENKDGMFQHGAQDDYKKPDGSPGRTPDKDEKFLVVDENGNTSTKNVDELKQLYDEKGIPWPY
jgi:RHS repeat-associated protein